MFGKWTAFSPVPVCLSLTRADAYMVWELLCKAQSGVIQVSVLLTCGPDEAQTEPLRWSLSYLCWRVQQTLLWTWCQRGPVSWWPHSHFRCLQKCPFAPPPPSPGLCTPWWCVRLKNKDQRSLIQLLRIMFSPFQTSAAAPTLNKSLSFPVLY